MFFNGIAYFFEQIYSQLNTTEADYSPYGLFSQPLCFISSLQELISSLIDDETAFVLDAIEGNRKEVGLCYHPFLFHI